MSGPHFFPLRSLQLLRDIELFTYHPTIATIIAPQAHISSEALRDYLATWQTSP
jgi:hypothetical protein